MANFSDYEKEYQQVREDFQTQINLDWQNLKLHIEQLRMLAKYFKQYDYLYILKCLEVAESKLDEAVSMIDGFETIPEDTIPEDEKFETDPELDQEPEYLPESAQEPCVIHKEEINPDKINNPRFMSLLKKLRGDNND